MVGLAGFAGACEKLAGPAEWQRICAIRDRFENRLREQLDGISICGQSSPRIPNTSNVRFHGIPGEVLLSAFDLDGLCVSSGSACSSGSVAASHVMLAMGYSEDEARECLRISWGQSTTEADIEQACQIIAKHVQRIRERRAS